MSTRTTGSTGTNMPAASTASVTSTASSIVTVTLIPARRLSMEAKAKPQSTMSTAMASRWHAETSAESAGEGGSAASRLAASDAQTMAVSVARRPRSVEARRGNANPTATKAASSRYLKRGSSRDV